MLTATPEILTAWQHFGALEALRDDDSRDEAEYERSMGALAVLVPEVDFFEHSATVLSSMTDDEWAAMSADDEIARAWFAAVARQAEKDEAHLTATLAYNHARSHGYNPADVAEYERLRDELED